jgi:hypothetical protein
MPLFQKTLLTAQYLTQAVRAERAVAQAAQVVLILLFIPGHLPVRLQTVVRTLYCMDRPKQRVGAVL